MTAALWALGFPFFFLFLFVPLFPLFGRREVWRCPVCGYETSGRGRFCPFDGTPLVGPEGGNEKKGQ